MLGDLSVAFLGTSAGDGPTASRGAPCTLVHLGKEIWMVDCGDGSYRQLQQFRALHSHRAVLPGHLSAQVDFSPRVPITRIFITHLHAGHVAGLALMLMRLLDEAVTAELAEQLDRDRDRDRGERPADVMRAPHIALIGPAGLRRFLRTSLGALRGGLAVPRGRYTVHELLLDDDARTPCVPSQLLQPCELPGRDVPCDRSGLWREFDYALGGEVVVSAGPILHTVPSIGFIFTEKSHGVPRRSGVFDPDASPPSSLELSRSVVGSSGSSGSSDDERDGASSTGGHSRHSSMTHTSVISPAVARERSQQPVFRGRKLVVLGDTCDASSLARLALDASLVIHEATDTHLPHESSGAVRERVVARGHSTAQMAGAFAKSVRAKQLVLNHFCARFPAPASPNDANARAMSALATQASTQWGVRDPKALVIAAKDFDILAIPAESSTYSPPPLDEFRPSHRKAHSQQHYPTAPNAPPYPQPMYPGPAPPPAQRGPSPTQPVYPDAPPSRRPSFASHSREPSYGDARVARPPSYNGPNPQVPPPPAPPPRPYTYPAAPAAHRGPSPPRNVFMESDSSLRPGHHHRQPSFSTSGQAPPRPSSRMRSF
ncbi:hypothetical protein EXIGLDRAFT_752343 [Exidia glandulosa HHB12029]|uniref:Metallo-beta-lactamase domain-containing protein n=1 Tax=Exidia glandulosa HHB12029 TaxID=1314781 RepID=A0A165EM80_EXIGL|nr:hypothetical protein EXIGLDRAFT_752343 [Exidia glandulosa HHB12029]